MQDPGGYIQQIPPGAAAPSAETPGVRRLAGGGALDRPAPPGVYVRIASARSQAEAVDTALQASQRFGAANPGHIRGVVASDEGEARIVLFAGPFVNAAAADRFCAGTLGGVACEIRVF